MINFLSVIKHLLPSGKAWRIVIDKFLKKIFQVIATLQEALKQFIDQVFEDLNPNLTRAVDTWLEQFGVLDNFNTEQEKRDRLAAEWKALGGQSPRYIQDTLQNAGFDVYIHEWWEPGTNPPVVRNPNLYINDGVSNNEFLVVCGNVNALCGNANAVSGSTADPKGYPLVNKIFVAFEGVLCCGYSTAVAGNPEAVAGRNFGFQFSRKRYIIPEDPDTWPYFWYVGGQNFPDLAQVPSARQDEFEDLILKIAPQQHWIGVLVEYV